ncbi:MAG: hypothetical protein ACRDVP_10180 [Acidimicrobiales bacterium]
MNLTETSTRSPEQLRAEAHHLEAQADRRETEIAAEAAATEAARAEQARQHAYLVAVEQGRTALDNAVRMHERAVADLDAARAEREHVRALVALAEQKVEAARAELSRLATGDDLDVLEKQRIAVVSTESVPGLLAPRLERAQRVARAAQEALEAAVRAVRTTWDALGDLGARDGLQRPACLPKPPALPDTPVTRLAREILDAACDAVGPEVGPKLAMAMVGGFVPESPEHLAARLKREALHDAGLREFMNSGSVRSLVRAATRAR